MKRIILIFSFMFFYPADTEAFVYSELKRDINVAVRQTVNFLENIFTVQKGKKLKFYEIAEIRNYSDDGLTVFLPLEYQGVYRPDDISVLSSSYYIVYIKGFDEISRSGEEDSFLFKGSVAKQLFYRPSEIYRKKIPAKCTMLKLSRNNREEPYNTLRNISFPVCKFSGYKEMTNTLRKTFGQLLVSGEFSASGRYFLYLYSYRISIRKPTMVTKLYDTEKKEYLKFSPFNDADANDAASSILKKEPNLRGLYYYRFITDNLKLYYYYDRLINGIVKVDVRTGKVEYKLNHVKKLYRLPHDEFMALRYQKDECEIIRLKTKRAIYKFACSRFSLPESISPEKQIYAEIPEYFDDTVYIKDLKNGKLKQIVRFKLKKELGGHVIRFAFLSPDGRFLAVQTNHSHIYLVSLKDNKLLWHSKRVSFKNQINSMRNPFLRNNKAMIVYTYFQKRTSLFIPLPEK